MVWPRSLRWLIPFALAVFLLPACSDSGDEAADTTLAPPTTEVAATNTTTTTVPATTTTVEGQTTTTPPVPDDSVTVTEDIVYLEMNGYEYLVDVYAPVGEGPWPVVVALHGGTVDKDNPILTVIAESAAEAGMLVFAPTWASEWSALTAEWVRTERPALPCALAFAQQEAAGYGGDSLRTVVYGHSGGATFGAQLVLGPNVALAPGCLAQTPPVTPVGAVFGDSEYFLHTTWWDGAFDQDLDEMQAIVAETVDPAFWAFDLPERFRLWAVTDEPGARSFDDPWDEDGWFTQRDPDGTIREDLDELGELDDGSISYIDQGLLLTSRLQQAGIDATFDLLPGAHDAHTDTPEVVVAYLLEAAGDG